MRLRLGSLMVVALIVISGCSDHTHPPLFTPEHSVAPPSGQKWVSYHGLSISVPDDFGVGPLFCTEPSKSWVLPDTGQAASCPAMTTTTPPPVRPALTVVALSPLSFDPALTRIATRPVTINGVHARQGSGSPRRLPREYVIAVPDVGVLISVTAPDAAHAQSIFGTVHVTPVDHLGCRARVTGFSPSGNPAGPELVPSGARSGVVCEYAPVDRNPRCFWLVGSARLTNRQIAAMPKEVNRLPAGDGPDPSLAGITVFEWFQLVYSHSTRVVAADIDIDPIGITDGHREVQTQNPGPLPDLFAG